MLRIQISDIDGEGFDDVLDEKIHYNNKKYIRYVVFNVFMFFKKDGVCIICCKYGSIENRM